MDPDTTPPDKPAPPATPSTLAKGEPDGGGATNLAGPPEPPPGAEAPAPADPPPRAPRLSPRVRSVLRVLLATLALGWWPLQTMRRHFEAGPYTGPMYEFDDEDITSVFGDDGKVGLMDDAGRIVAALGEWDDFRPIAGPEGTYWLVSRTKNPLVLRFDGQRPVRRDAEKFALLDGSGRRVWQTSVPLVMTMTRFMAQLSLDVYWEQGLEMLRVERNGADGARSQLVTLDGQVALEADQLASTYKDLPLILARDDMPGAASMDEVPVRALLLQGGRWIELANHPYLEFDMELLKSERYGTLDMDGVLCGLRVNGGKPQTGMVREDLRWMLPWWFRGDSRGALIANAPGSQAGDPPVYTIAERVDGAWLALWATDTRMVLRGGLWGLQGADGRWLVEPRWAGAFALDEGSILGLEVDGRQSVVDLEGRELLPPVRAIVLNNWTSGNDAYGPCFVAKGRDLSVSTGAEQLADGVARVLSPTGDLQDFDSAGPRRFGILGAKGEWVLPPIYTDISKVELVAGRSRYVVRPSGSFLMGVLRPDGTAAVPIRYVRMRPLAEDYWYLEPPGEVLPTPYQKGGLFNEATDLNPWAWAWWGEGGRIVKDSDAEWPPLDLQCEFFRPLPGVGYLVVRQGKIGLVDWRGREILPATYARLR